MVQGARRRRPESAAARAKRLEALTAKYPFIAAASVAPSLETTLWGLTEPGRFAVPLRFVGERAVGLAATFELRRRACVLRAWLCARAMHKAGHPSWRRDWRRRLAEQLREAKNFRRLSLRACAEESR